MGAMQNFLSCVEESHQIRCIKLTKSKLLVSQVRFLVYHLQSYNTKLHKINQSQSSIRSSDSELSTYRKFSLLITVKLSS